LLLLLSKTRKHQQNNDSNNKSPNEKTTKAYKLFDEGKKPVDVAVRLSLSIKDYPQDLL
jgi:hypothetical protein